MTVGALLERAPVQIANLDRALTPDAHGVWEKISRILQGSEAGPVGSNRRQAVNRLRAAYIRALAPDWDGGGADPVDVSTFEYTLQLIALLPADLPVPDVFPEADGELALEWDFGPRNVFSVSVGRDGTLTFAGLFGRSKLHGVEYLGDRIPEAIWICLSKLAIPRI